MKMKDRFKSLAVLVAALCITLSARAWTAADSAVARSWADSVLGTMDTEERVSQLFICLVGAEDTEVNKEELREQAEVNKVGGVLFQKGTMKGQATLTNMTREWAKVPMLVAADAEWGLQMRLRDALRFPRKMSLSAMRDEELIGELADEVGRHCELMGIGMNFDPVVDVNTNPENPVINIRAWSDDAGDVARKSYLFLQGMRNHGIICTAKHFPGHGDTETDSHVSLPVVRHAMGTLDSVDLYPYRYLIERGVLDGVMVGHLSVEALDSTGTPASLSRRISTGLLREEMGFKGVTVTDAMVMGAVAKREGAAVEALKAGADMILDMGNVKATHRGIESVLRALKDSVMTEEEIAEKCRRVLMAKHLTGTVSRGEIDTATIVREVNSARSRTLQEEAGRRCVTVLKNKDELLPLRALGKRITFISVCKGTDTYFLNRASLYCHGEKLSLTSETTENEEEMARVDSVLRGSDVAVFAIHDNLVSDSVIAELSRRVKGKVVQVYFLSPYLMAPYVESRKEADAIAVAYENAQCVQQAAAEMMMGGAVADGRLPVSIPALKDKKEMDTPPYVKGQGLVTRKTRLAYGTAESVGMSSDSLKWIDSIVTRAIEDTCAPGCQVLVARRGKVVYRKAFGNLTYADPTDSLESGQAVTMETLYDVASVTKLAATTIAIMKLVDDGKVDLDRPVTHYLHKMKKMHGISVRDLLMHQSGLKPSERLWIHAFENGNLSKEKDPIHGLHVADSMWLRTTYHDSIKHWLTQMVPAQVSGNAYKYSDLNFMILQMIVEKVSKQSLDMYLEGVYRDLGCYNTLFNPKDKDTTLVFAPTEYDNLLRHQLIDGYVHDENAAFAGGVSGHAGLFSTADDLAKLMQMILNKGTYGDECFVGEETTEMFLTEKSDRSRRGLGFDRMQVPEDPESSTMKTRHEMLGHTGFTGTCVWIDPKEELIYVFLSNRVYPTRGTNKLARTNVRTDIAEVIYKAITE